MKNIAQGSINENIAIAGNAFYPAYVINLTAQIKEIDRINKKRGF